MIVISKRFFFKGLENVEILDRFGERMWKIGEGWFVCNSLTVVFDKLFVRNFHVVFFFFR
jgi:hypothetical protein